MLPDSPVLYVFSGAGLSAESGISTFRDKDGAWSRFDINTVCNLQTWQDHREEVFAFYGARRAELQHVTPNDAHRALARWQTRWGSNRVKLLTQNVDGLLEAAGATDVVHLHGDLQDLRCTACDKLFRVPANDWGGNTPCPTCRQVEPVKPGVVFFNERSDAYEHIYNMRDSVRPQDIILVVGTSLMVITAEQLFPSRRFGHANNWQVNPAPDRSDYFGLVIAEPATTGLAGLEARLARHMNMGASSSSDFSSLGWRARLTGVWQAIRGAAPGRSS